MIEFTQSWRSHKKGERVQLHDALENRLVQINKAKRIELPGVDHLDKLHEHGLHTVEQILNADLTLIDGIGEKTSEKIKSQVKDVYNNH